MVHYYEKRIIPDTERVKNNEDDHEGGRRTGDIIGADGPAEQSDDRSPLCPACPEIISRNQYSAAGAAFPRDDLAKMN